MTFEEELDLTADRMRGLSPSRLQAQEEAFRRTLALLTDRPVQHLEPRAWGDQLAVIGREVPAHRRSELVPALVALRRCFDLLP
jgi:hypothetical protein